MRPLKRPLMIFSALLLVAWSMSVALKVWPELSITKADALRVANEFMMDLHEGDALGAASKLTPEAREAIAGDDGYQLAVVHRPVDWRITSFDGFHAQGTVSFADGKVLALKISMQWRYTGWYVYGLRFGERDTLRIDWLISD